MYCYNCGNHLKDEDRFCEKCGMPVQPVVQNQAPAEEPAAEPVAEPAAEPVRQTAAEPAPRYAPPQYTIQQPVKEESRLMGILSLICGIGSFLLGWIPFLMFIPEALAVVFGIVGIFKKQGKVQAIVGIILAVAAFLMTALMTLIVCLLLIGEIGAEFFNDFNFY
ncbi:MAG: zinc-ribbon domain-containing protein [Clostridia bacterium]|nr:zinc-ribbon domain-containing protein [Clostridia bacterium]